jgi:hypothetical protein
VQRLAGTTPTGAIFYLMNAFRDDYQEKSDITSGGLPISSLNESDQKAITELRDLLKHHALSDALGSLTATPKAMVRSVISASKCADAASA